MPVEPHGGAPRECYALSIEAFGGARPEKGGLEPEAHEALVEGAIRSKKTRAD